MIMNDYETIQKQNESNAARMNVQCRKHIEYCHRDITTINLILSMLNDDIRFVIDINENNGLKTKSTKMINELADAKQCLIDDVYDETFVIRAYDLKHFYDVMSKINPHEIDLISYEQMLYYFNDISKSMKQFCHHNNLYINVDNEHIFFNIDKLYRILKMTHDLFVEYTQNDDVFPSDENSLSFQFECNHDDDVDFTISKIDVLINMIYQYNDYITNDYYINHK